MLTGTPRRGADLVLPPQPSTVLRATLQDRGYFAANPNAAVLVRRPVRGEFGPLEHPPGTLVRVRRLGPGLRTRELLEPERRAARCR